MAASDEICLNLDVFDDVTVCDENDEKEMDYQQTNAFTDCCSDSDMEHVPSTSTYTPNTRETV